MILTRNTYYLMISTFSLSLRSLLFDITALICNIGPGLLCGISAARTILVAAFDSVPTTSVESGKSTPDNLPSAADVAVPNTAVRNVRKAHGPSIVIGASPHRSKRMIGARGTVFICFLFNSLRKVAPA